MDREVLEEIEEGVGTMNGVALQIEGLEKLYPKFALGPVDLSVPRGVIFGLIGPNGAGKTTLLHCVMGMAKKRAGRVLVEGLDHRRDEAAAKAKIGFSGPVLNWRAWGKIEKAAAFLKPFYPGWDDVYCLRLMERFGLNPGEKIASLSFGSQTKLSLTLAMAHRPPLLILDEPTAGLDASARRVLFEELLDTVESGERTAIVSSHDLSDLERYTDRVGILRRGRMMAEGAPAELCERYRQLRFAPPPGWQPPEGCRIVRRRGENAELLIEVDRTAELRAAGLPTEKAAPVNLEELFLGLTDGGEA